LSFSSDFSNTILKLGVLPKGDRYDYLRICCGDETLSNMKMSKIFMVGAGAIGCELLKNFAMLGLGT